MLPVLLHRVANVTQHLNGLSALLALDPGTLEARGEDLAVTSREVDETGWLLALLASACGARLLLARRERAGLRSLVGCVRDCLRRERRDLAVPDGPLAELAAGARDGWQVPWALATLLYEAGRALPAGETLRWSLVVSETGSRLECRSPDVDGSRLRPWLARHLADGSLETGGGEALLTLPPGTLVGAAEGT